MGVVVEEAVGALEWVGGGQEGAEEGAVGLGEGEVLLDFGELEEGVVADVVGVGRELGDGAGDFETPSA